MDQDFFAFLPSDLTHKRPASKRPKRTFERFRSGWGWDSVLWMSPDQRLRFWALHHRTNGILGIGKILPEILKCMMYHFLRGTKKPQDLDTIIYPFLPSFLWEGLLCGRIPCPMCVWRSGAKQVLKKVQLVGAFPMLKTTWIEGSDG